MTKDEIRRATMAALKVHMQANNARFAVLCELCIFAGYAMYAAHLGDRAETRRWLHEAASAEDLLCGGSTFLGPLTKVLDAEAAE